MPLLTYQYQYDNSGNRTSQTVTASGQSAPQLSETFSYTNGILSGVAKSENGVLENVTYTSDRMGSILTRTAGSTIQTFTWGEGRMLLGVSVDASNNAAYTYDASGLRRQKVVTTNGQTITTNFIWGNNGLVGFTQGDTVVTVLYDVENQPVGFTVNDAVYTYVKNIQGDVMKVLDSAGNTVISYSYDPWGVPTITGNTALAALNPCSYRGYYYDFETGFYYLQSRYYDPKVERFLSIDDPSTLAPEQCIVSGNGYLYCFNSPIIYVDKLGYWAEKYPGFATKDWGFSVYYSSDFLDKDFCISFTKDVARRFGNWNWFLWEYRFRNMGPTRMAKELYAHAVLYCIGVGLMVTSEAQRILSVLLSLVGENKVFVSAWQAVSYLQYKLGRWLFNHAKQIDVNNNESSFRMFIYNVIWVVG